MKRNEISKKMMIVMVFFAVAIVANAQRLIRGIPGRPSNNNIEVKRYIVPANTNLIKMFRGNRWTRETVSVYPDSVVWSFKNYKGLQLKDVLTYNRKEFMALIDSIAGRPYRYQIKWNARPKDRVSSISFLTAGDENAKIDCLSYEKSDECDRIYRLVMAFINDHTTEGNRILNKTNRSTSLESSDIPENLKPYKVE